MTQVGARRLVAGFLIAVAMISLGCGGAPQAELDVRPLTICSGDTVHVSWTATENARLHTEPKLPLAGPVARRGTAQIALSDTTLFRLIAPSGGDTTRWEREVVVVAPSHVLAFRTAPAGDTAVVAGDSIPAAAWNEQIRLETVASHSDRRIVVRHGGQEVALPADSSPSPALEGLRVSGDWELWSPLLPEEGMQDPNNPPPQELRVGIQLQCP